MFIGNSRNTRTRCDVCSKLAIKTPERRRSGVFIADFEHISHLTYFKPSSVSIVNFEQVNAYPRKPKFFWCFWGNKLRTLARNDLRKLDKRRFVVLLFFQIKSES